MRGQIDADLVVEQNNLSKRLTPVISSEVGKVDRQTGKTLVYKSTHHYAAVEILLHSPLAMRKMHRLTVKQYTWVTLRARAKVEACIKRSLWWGRGGLRGRKPLAV